VVGTPRTHISLGGFLIVFDVQSPALEIIEEKPVFPGSAIVAKPCHSVRGLSESRIKLPGSGVSTMMVND